MRVCIHKETGRLIESQSNDGASLQTLVDNAVSAGFAAEDVEAKVVTPAEFAVLVEAAKPEPNYRQKRAAAYVERLTDGDPTMKEAVGDVLDAIIKEVRALRSGGAMDADFAGKVAKIDQIKADIPKE